MLMSTHLSRNSSPTGGFGDPIQQQAQALLAWKNAGGETGPSPMGGMPRGLAPQMPPTLMIPNMQGGYGVPRGIPSPQVCAGVPLDISTVHLSLEGIGTNPVWRDALAASLCDAERSAGSVRPRTVFPWGSLFQGQLCVVGACRC